MLATPTADTLATATYGTLSAPTAEDRVWLAEVDAAAKMARRFRRATPDQIRAEVARLKAAGALTAPVKAAFDYLLERDA